jgi:hypothetical protein
VVKRRISEYVARGTVQVQRGFAPSSQFSNDTKTVKIAASVAVNPVPDYAVKHGKKDYVIFMQHVPDTTGDMSVEDSLQCKAFETKHHFAVVNRSITAMLIHTALRSVAVDLFIDDNGQVVAVKLPATRDR